MKLILLLALLLVHSSLPAESDPVTNQNQILRDATPWVTEYWNSYSGTYDTTREVDGNARVILTAFSGAKGVKLISVCMIIISDVMVEPSYQIHGSIIPDEKTGELGGPSIVNWRMISYIDPVTKDAVFGISIDGTLYVDHTKTIRAEQAGTGQPATRPESKSEGSDKPQPEAEGRSR